MEVLSYAAAVYQVGPATFPGADTDADAGQQVADFGLSRVLSAEAVSTGTYGTVTHMPIELLTTGESVTGSS